MQITLTKCSKKIPVKLSLPRSETRNAIPSPFQQIGEDLTASRLFDPPSEPLPLISVIIPVYLDFQMLENCLKSIELQTYPRNNIEIILVNNAPDTILPSWASRTAKIINQPMPGSYAARNAGIAEARGSILAFTDSDCTADPNWLKNGVTKLLEATETGCVGGSIKIMYSSNRPSLATCYERVFGFRQDLIDSGRKYSVTANMIVWTSVFEETGLFSDQLLSGGDTEWGSRLQRTGWKLVYASNAMIYHPARERSAQILSKTIRISGGQYTLAKTNLKRTAILLFGFIPPVHKLAFILKTPKVSTYCRALAFIMLWLHRTTRSITFLTIALGLSSPRRT